MPRVRAHASSVTTEHDGKTYNVTTQWTVVPQAVMAKIAHLVDVEDDAPAQVPSADRSNTERPMRRSRKE